MNEALLSIENLRVTFGSGKTQTEVLHGLDLHVGRGEAVGLNFFESGDVRLGGPNCGLGDFDVAVLSSVLSGENSGE